ncbi:MAG: hemolysin secretion protein, partial [Moraxellaceae bacterium]|nr:hemolysin secretion protein [Moraxellaceae bacterium]
MNPHDRLLQRLSPLHLRRNDALLVTCGALLVIAALWAALAHVEEQIRAPGTVIASSRSQIVQSVDGGTLKALHVKEGDTVK